MDHNLPLGFNKRDVSQYIKQMMIGLIVSSLFRRPWYIVGWKSAPNGKGL